MKNPHHLGKLGDPFPDPVVVGHYIDRRITNPYLRDGAWVYFF